MSRGRRAIRALAAAGVTAAVLATLVWTIRPGPILDALAATDLLLLGVAVVLALLFNTVQSAEVLRWTLRGLGQRITFIEALSATAGNMAIKAALPAGTGELARAAYLHRACGVQAASATAVVVAILWLKLCWLLALALLGWALQPGTCWLHGAAVAGALGATTMLPRLARRQAPNPVQTEPPATGWRRVAAAVATSVASVQPGPLAIGALHALLAVVAEMVVFALLLQAGGVRPELDAILAALPLAIIGAKIPITLLGLGSREVLIVTLMAGTCSAAALAGAGLLFSLVEYVLPAALGAALTWSYVRRILDGR